MLCVQNPLCYMPQRFHYSLNKSDIVCTLQVDDNKLVATCYEQYVSVILEQLVASLLPSSTL
jgi:hypothetical protein